MQFIVILITLLLAICSESCYSQPEIIWQRCFGGTASDGFQDAQKTLDGGYICLGSSSSEDFDLQDVCCWPGAPDFWIVKLDSNFNIEWQKLIGSNVAGDIPANIFCNPDTSYTIFGQVGSNTDDCLCNHSSSQDIWMIIVDEIGNIISQKCFGGSSYDLLNNISKCEDSGYIIGASSGSYDGDVGIHYGSPFSHDAFIVKTDALGNIEWTKTLGGSGYDGAWVAGISQNRCLISINTSSTDYDLEGMVPVGESSGRLLMLVDEDGTILKQTFDRSYDFLFELFRPYEYKFNQFLLVGRNQIDTGFFDANIGGADATVALYDSNLILKNVYQFGGSTIDVFEQMVKFDTSYYFTGFTYSSDFDAQECNGETDVFIVKTDTLFNKIWSKTLGATFGDRVLQLMPIDSNLLLFGQSGVNGINDGDIIGAHYDEELGSNGEGWIMIMDDVPLTIDTPKNDLVINIYPNPSSQIVIIEIVTPLQELITLELFSIAGKRILKRKLQNNTLNEINISNLPSGYYLLNLIFENKIVKTERIFIY